MVVSPSLRSSSDPGSDAAQIVRRPSLPPALKQDIEKFRMEDFAKKYFSEQVKRGWFRRKVIPAEDMIHWQKEVISQPLLPIGSLKEQAIKSHKLILMAMGDKSSKKENVELIQELVTLGIHNGRLRDEILVQIVKQLTNNPNQRSLVRGYEILSCVLEHGFPPSRDLEVYVKHFLRNQAVVKEGDLKTMILWTQKQLDKICRVGARGKLPNVEELERARKSAFVPCIFGANLEELVQREQEQEPDRQVPKIVDFLTKGVMECKGDEAEGIFRVPGDGDQVSKLRLRIENGQYDLTGIDDPHAAATLLKTWLRQLEEAIILDKVYDDCIQLGKTVDLEDEINARQRAWKLIETLPPAHYHTIKTLVQFLQPFIANAAMTKMKLNSMIIVLAPCLLRCPSQEAKVILENNKYEQSFLRLLFE